MGFWYRIAGNHDQMMPGLIFRPGVLDRLGIAHLQDVDIAKEWRAVPSSDSLFVIGPREGWPVEWLRISDDLEVGWFEVPDPVQLERPGSLPGSHVSDASGRSWLIPNGNPKSARCTIPQDYQWSMSGPRLVPDERFAPVVNLCEETFQEMLAAESLSKEWTASRALEILQLNYRIGLPELMAFEHLKSPVINKLMAAATVAFFVDHELLEDVVKKK